MGTASASEAAFAAAAAAVSGSARLSNLDGGNSGMYAGFPRNGSGTLKRLQSSDAGLHSMTVLFGSLLASTWVTRRVQGSLYDTT